MLLQIQPFKMAMRACTPSCFHINNHRHAAYAYVRHNNVTLRYVTVFEMRFDKTCFSKMRVIGQRGPSVTFGWDGDLG